MGPKGRSYGAIKRGFAIIFSLCFDKLNMTQDAVGAFADLPIRGFADSLICNYCLIACPPTGGFICLTVYLFNCLNSSTTKRLKLLNACLPIRLFADLRICNNFQAMFRQAQHDKAGSQVV